jgi:hypothetical protein
MSFFQQEESARITALVQAEAFLQTGKFGEFWVAMAEEPLASVAAETFGFEEAIRSCESLLPLDILLVTDSIPWRVLPLP